MDSARKVTLVCLLVFANDLCYVLPEKHWANILCTKGLNNQMVTVALTEHALSVVDHKVQTGHGICLEHISLADIKHFSYAEDHTEEKGRLLLLCKTGEFK